MSDELKVTFQPSGQSVYVLRGTRLLEAAGLAGIILETPCGGRGTCGKCRVRVVSGRTGGDGAVAPQTPEAHAKGFRLACRASVESDLVVAVPEESRFQHAHQILTGDSGARGNLNPVVRKLRFELAPPTSEDQRADRSRFIDAIGDAIVASRFTRELPGFLRRSGWKGTAVLTGRKLIALETGDTTGSVRGVAFDLGTTTVVGTLLDLRDGRELAVCSRMNSQIAYGDDVVSRIHQVRQRPAALAQLQEAAVETMNEIISELVREAGVSAETVYEIVVAGNATMQQILCGYDPSALGEVPFVQVFHEAQTLSAHRVGLKSNPGADLYVMDQVGGFVGGDTVAGMLAARLDRCDGAVVLVDIGTNGEIVLAHDGRLWATSAAAGPAFEGARIRQGMRATKGAIEKVIIDGDVTYNVIGNAHPVGLCGTALIDAAAGLLRAGVLDATGRILPPDELPPDVAPGLRARVVVENEAAHFVLVPGHATAGGEDIRIWQRDVRELQLATGAIRAAINILLRRAGLAPADVSRVLLAGAFGNFIRRSSARRIGLLPQIPCDRIRFIGNAASLGAKLALLSVDERRYAGDLRRRARHIDLSLDPDFQSEFGMAMMFPEADVDACD